jgi:hypothetical protein
MMQAMQNDETGSVGFIYRAVETRVDRASAARDLCLFCGDWLVDKLCGYPGHRLTGYLLQDGQCLEVSLCERPQSATECENGSNYQDDKGLRPMSDSALQEKPGVANVSIGFLSIGSAIIT